MNVVLIPFFLAAHIAVDTPWEYGPLYTFQIQVNSTAIPEEGIYGSVRLNVASKLICQPKEQYILSCHFEDSQADSYLTESLDPDVPADPVGKVSRQEAYEIDRDQFEIKFDSQGLESLVVNENIQPQELDMIRVIVGQLNIGTIIGEQVADSFETMENFTQGECATSFKVDRKTGGHALYVKRGYELTGDQGAFGLKDGQSVQVQKQRNLSNCTHKVPYFFGSAESFRQVSDVVSTISAANSHILITSTEFISGSSNVLTASKATETMGTTLYENISLRLVSIQPAKSPPPEVKDAEPASIFIGKWFMETSSEEED